MKNNLFLPLLAACLLAFAACQSTSNQQADLSEIKPAIQALEDDWAEALANQDLDALMALYTDDAVAMPNGAVMVTGKAAIRQHQQRDFASQPAGMTFSFQTKDLFGTPDEVTETGTATYKDADGNVIGTGNYMVVWVKQDGKYLCARDIYNNEQPPAPAASKSIHLFDLPADVTEAEWSAALAEMNGVVADLGYPGSGYIFYKTGDADTDQYRYYFEGRWPGEEAYQKIHESAEFKAAAENLGPLYDKIAAVEIYRRVHRVQ